MFSFACAACVSAMLMVQKTDAATIYTADFEASSGFDDVKSIGYNTTGLNATYTGPAGRYGLVHEVFGGSEQPLFTASNGTQAGFMDADVSIVSNATALAETVAAAGITYTFTFDIARRFSETGANFIVNLLGDGTALATGNYTGANLSQKFSTKTIEYTTVAADVGKSITIEFDANNSGQRWFDNVHIVPEPSTALLFALSAPLLMLRRR